MCISRILADVLLIPQTHETQVTTCLVESDRVQPSIQLMAMEWQSKHAFFAGAFSSPAPQSQIPSGELT